MARYALNSKKLLYRHSKRTPLSQQAHFGLGNADSSGIAVGHLATITLSRLLLMPAGLSSEPFSA